MAGESDVRVGQILILLVILCSAGGWNYHRNALIENGQPRPYRGYSDEELHQLMSAYQDEVDVQMARYRKSAGTNQMQAQGSGLLDEDEEEFVAEADDEDLLEVGLEETLLEKRGVGDDEES